MNSKVLYDKKDRWAYVTLNRPDKLNAIDDEMYDALWEAFARAEADDEVLAVVIRGNGRAFCAGADMSPEMVKVMPPRPINRPFMGGFYAWDEAVRQRWQYLFRLSKHTVCGVQGYALGWGCDLAMLCDVSIVTESAVLGDPSIRMGFASHNPIWSWRVGPRMAKDLLLTGRSVGGKEAQEIGLVTRWVPDEKLDADVEEAVQAVLNRGGMVGYDARWMRRRGWYQVLDAVSGVDAAWKFTANYHAMSSIQRRGFAPGEFDFYLVRDVEGLPAAIEQRDAPYRQYFPEGAPTPASDRG